MINKILPLPVKKNKFGEKVADISIEKYYRQICEEVLEAYTESYYMAEDEAEELADIITCCITRLDIMHWYEDYEDFGKYVVSVIHECQSYYEEPKDFYTDLSAAVMQSYHAARTGKIIDYLHKEGCGSCAEYIGVGDYDEECALGYIIVMCIERLEKIGYKGGDRELIYDEVNEKNRKRGYFEE